MAIWNNLFKINEDRASKKVDSNSYLFEQLYNYGTYYKQWRNNSTVIACRSLIANTVSTMPCFLMQRFGNTVPSKAYSHPLFDLLFNEPNLEQTPKDFFHKLTLDILDGNAYIRVIRDTKGNPVSLFLFDPTKIRVARDSTTFEKIYTIGNRTYNSTELVQIMSPYNNGLIGFPVSSLAEDAISLGSQLDEFLLNNFSQQISTNMIFDVAELLKGTTDEAKRAQLVKEQYAYIQSMYAGVKNTGKPLMVHSGMTATAINTNTNQQQQVAELKSLQEKDICKIYGVPVWKVTGEIKYTDIESANISFLQDCINPWLSLIEQALGKILNPVERQKGQLYFEFDPSVMLRTDTTKRIDSYTKQLTNGILSINEIRKLESLPPVEAGDNPFIMGNLIPLNNETVNAMMANQKKTVSEIQNDQLDNKIK